MYYVEFYSHKPEVDQEKFEETIKRTNAYWFSKHTQDLPTLAIGRTWRLGGPRYMVVVEIDSAARIDEWTEQRRSDPEAARAVDEWLSVVDCDAGLYEEIGLEQL
jgi:hypothetical protein